jgi:hypothetical protein
MFWWVKKKVSLLLLIFSIIIRLICLVIIRLICLDALDNKYIMGFLTSVFVGGLIVVVIYAGSPAFHEQTAVVVKSIIPCFSCFGYKRFKSKLEPLLPFVPIISLFLFISLFAYFLPLPLPLFLITKLSLKVVKVFFSLKVVKVFFSQKVVKVFFSLKVVKVFFSLKVRLEKKSNSTLALPIKNWKYFKLIGKCFVLVRNWILSGVSFVLNFSSPYFKSFVVNGTLGAVTIALLDVEADANADRESSSNSIIIGPLMVEAQDGTPMRVLGKGITSGLSPEPPEPQSANSTPTSEPVSKGKCLKGVRCIKRVLDLFCS